LKAVFSIAKMKLLISFLVSFLFQRLLAQNITGLPDCGQYCVNQVTALAVAQAQCNVNHATCYCTRGDFINAVNTCANSQCTSDTDKSIVSAFANGYCGDAKSNPSSSSTSTGPSSSASPTASQASQTSTSTATPSPKSSSSLSGGAIAGIVIGVVAALIVAGLAFFLIRKRRAAAHTSTDGEYFHEIDASDAAAKKETAEKLDAKELWVPPVVHELPGTEGINNRSTLVAGESPTVERASPDVSPETQSVSPVDAAARPAESRS